jgi:hypothetical protein
MVFRVLVHYVPVPFDSSVHLFIIRTEGLVAQRKSIVGRPPVLALSDSLLIMLFEFPLIIALGKLYLPKTIDILRFFLYMVLNVF